MWAAVTGTFSMGGCHQREWLPHVRHQEQKPGGPHAQEETAKRSYPTSDVRGGSQEELPRVRVRGGGQEEQPHLQGAGAARAQEGLEELFHVHSL